MNFQFILACTATDSFPISDGVEIEQANEKRASEGARLGSPHPLPLLLILPLYFATLSQSSSHSRAFGKRKEMAATQAKFIWKTSLQIQDI